MWFIKGSHTVLEREVAIKVLHPNLTCDPIVEKRFLREARSIGRIKNKHVVEVLNFGKTEDEALYIVMEYIDGTILSQALREEKYLEPSRAIHIITQICEALSAAHAQGVIHRDFKACQCDAFTKPRTSRFCQTLRFWGGQNFRRDRKHPHP